MNLTLLVRQIVQVVIVFYGVFLIRDGVISMGALIACVILTAKTLSPLSQLAQVLTRLNQARVVYHQIDAIMVQEVERQPGRRYLSRRRIEGQNDFKGVSFAYDGALGSILKDIDLAIKPGGKVAI
ncbi:hypothetical protein K3740_19560 (plasmid) [Ruegeria conchae]|uniref:hypothetical protein n=1 Tax=Ruegeria conchae TaxID=981384 RepID=UPI00147B52E9|nr:hypothetical protein [Ruegeria conchae]UWR05470.1 hypothetical protein K3740_19560 [Ruegeria conchae]